MTVIPVVDVMALDVHSLSRKKDVADCPEVLSKIGSRQWFSRQTYTMLVRIELFHITQSSEHCWILVYAEIISQLFLHWPRNIETAPWNSGRALSGRMNHDSSFITSMALSRYVIFQANSSPLKYSKSYAVQWWRYYALSFYWRIWNP